MILPPNAMSAGLTPARVVAMRPGVRMDVMIGERLLGWRFEPINFHWRTGNELYFVPDPVKWRHGHSPYATTSGSWYRVPGSRRRFTLNNGDMPRWSTDDGAAWKDVTYAMAVRRVGPEYKHMEIAARIDHADRNNRYRVVFRDRKNQGPTAYGHTLAVAICRAALLATLLPPRP